MGRRQIAESDLIWEGTLSDFIALEELPRGPGVTLYAKKPLDVLGRADKLWVLDTRMMGPDDDAPETAATLKLKELLTMSTVQQVATNAELQLRRKPSSAEFLKALRFYWGNDAFISFF